MKQLVLFLALISPLAALANQGSTGSSQRSEDDLEGLKATSERYLAAWGASDIDTIVDIESDAVGFGHSTAFARPRREAEEKRTQLQWYFEQVMDTVQITPLSVEYQVVGNTGLVWGHYSQTTKQKEGPLRTVYLRFAHTYVKLDGKWKLVLYHRSLIPSENIP